MRPANNDNNGKPEKNQSHIYRKKHGPKSNIHKFIMTTDNAKVTKNISGR